jgi:hypothetical protein
MYPDSPFGAYNPEMVNFPVPPQITSALRGQFDASERARGLAAALETMVRAAGKDPTKMGPGYSYLRQIADAMQDFGGVPGGGQSRANYAAMLGALDPLMAESKDGGLSAFGPIARMLTQPFFSAGVLRPDRKGDFEPRFF